MGVKWYECSKRDACRKEWVPQSRRGVQNCGFLRLPVPVGFFFPLHSVVIFNNVN
jgi:hypothetical protein